MKLFIISATLALSGAAHATHCTNGLPDSYYPQCIPPTTTSAPSTSASDSRSQAAAAAAAAAAAQATAKAAATAGMVGSGNSRNELTQRQQQQQAQQQANISENTNRNAANAAGAGANTGNGNGGGGAYVGGDNYHSTALALPSVPMTPPSVVAGAVVSTTVSKCGPLQRIVAESIYGEHDGIFSNRQIWLGNTEKTDNYLDENGNWKLYIANGGRWNGHEVIYSTAALSVSSAANLTIGGGSSGGGWGQGGGGVSGAMQRMVTTIQLRLCDAGPVAVIEPPRPPAIVPPPVVRKPVHRRTKPTCVTATLPICKAS